MIGFGMEVFVIRFVLIWSFEAGLSSLRFISFGVNLSVRIGKNMSLSLAPPVGVGIDRIRILGYIEPFSLLSGSLLRINHTEFGDREGSAYSFHTRVKSVNLRLVENVDCFPPFIKFGTHRCTRNLQGYEVALAWEPGAQLREPRSVSQADLSFTKVILAVPQMRGYRLGT